MLLLAIGFPKTDGSNVKRPRPTALKDNMHRLGRVGRFTPNPALPKDQPLRGSWHNEFLLSWTRVLLACVILHVWQTLIGRFLIKRTVQSLLYGGYKRVVVTLQFVGSATTACL